jgi:hypothetical protein
MSKRLLVVLFAGIIAFALTPTAAWGVCVVRVVSSVTPDPAPAPNPSVQITPTVAPAGGAIINQEGLTERVADVLINDDGVAPNCFGSTTQVIRLTYNAALTSPVSIPVQTRSNFDVYDSAGAGLGLAIQASSTVALAPGGTQQTVITITLLQAGTAGNITTGAVGSAIRVKNLRVDSADQLTKAPAAGSAATVAVSATFPGTFVTAAFTVGTATATIAPGASIAPVGNGAQSSGSGLSVNQAGAVFAENFAPAFRRAGTCVARATTCPSGVSDDIATTPTSLIFDMGTSIPSGVTVTFPSTMSTSAEAAIGTAGVVFTLTGRGGSGSCTGSAACFVIYDTTATGATAFTLPLATVAGVAPVGAPLVLGAAIQIGVQVGSPSGSGTATLHASFGPGQSAGSGNDDVNAAAVPRYIAANTSASATTRNIFSGSFFVIAPVRTTLLYSFATTLGGFNTGIEVANTGADTGAFAAANVGQTGGLTLFFFQKAAGAAPNTFTLGTDLSAGGVALPNCRGLDANGRVPPGGVFACALSSLLAAAGQPAAFDGYVIVVSQFTKAHGFYATFNAAGAPFAANNALVMGAAVRQDGAAEAFTQ